LAALREQLAQREKQIFGRKTERRPAGEDTLEANAAPKKKKKGKGHGPTQQPALPVVTVVHSLAGGGLNCAHCGGQLKPLGTEAEESELIALEARKLFLERHLRTKYQCPCCNTGVTTASGPVKLIPGGRYALSFTLEVAFLKYLAHMPLDRQAQMFRQEGLKVTTATLYDQIDALDTRSAEGAAIILGPFSGTLMVDGLTSYPAAAKTGAGQPPKFLIANCHVRARRKFVECEQNAAEESRFVLDLYQELYAIERAVRGAKGAGRGSGFLPGGPECLTPASGTFR
jgi:transposase